MASFLSKAGKGLKKCVKEIDKLGKKAIEEVESIHLKKCAYCSKLMRRKVFTYEGKLCHEKCAPRLRCYVCTLPLPQNCKSFPIYDHIYCGDIHEDVKSCSACPRKRPTVEQNDSFKDLTDGRLLCPVCYASTLIEDNSEAQEIFVNVVDFMESTLGLVIPGDMRSNIVYVNDAFSLNNLSKSNGSCCPGVLRGLTISYRTPVAGGEIDPDLGSESLCLDCDVEIRGIRAVHVLDKMPEDLCNSVIAHEAMHVWLKLNEKVPFSLKPKVEEGLCQVLAYQYLEYINKQHDQSSLDSNGSCSGGTSVDESLGEEESQERKLLRKYLSYQIENDLSDVYGKGYKEAKKCVDALGLNIVLEFLIDSGGDLPVV